MRLSHIFCPALCLLAAAATCLSAANLTVDVNAGRMAMRPYTGHP